jgi:hypothetical protein
MGVNHRSAPFSRALVGTTKAYSEREPTLLWESITPTTVAIEKLTYQKMARTTLR